LQSARRGAENFALRTDDLITCREAVRAGIGRLHWSAHYRFGKAQRPVHNQIEAMFRFDAAGHITQHHDQFDFWRWVCPACCWDGPRCCAGRSAQKR